MHRWDRAKGKCGAGDYRAGLRGTEQDGWAYVLSETRGGQQCEGVRSVGSLWGL